MKQIFFILVILFLSACSTPTAVVNAPAIAPNVAAVYANQTKQALLDQAAYAQQQEDALNSQSTATAAAATAEAFAPFAQATQAAVNLQVQKMYGDATSTSAAATQTAYAVQQAYYAQATNVSGAATQIAAVTQQAFLVQQDIDAKAAQRRDINNRLWAIIPPVLLLCIVVYVFITLSRYLRHKSIARDDYGKTQPILDIVKGEYVDLSASPNYAHKDQSIIEQMFVQYLEKKYGFVPNAPRITADRQDLVKEREQVIEVERIRRARLPKALIDAQSLRFLPEPIDEAADLQDSDILLPEWSIINGWDGQSRPLGLGRQGIIIAQAASPHLLVSGKTGTGKTGYMLRTQATASLAKGYQVINLAFSDSGFGVFIGHPNYHSVKLDQASDIIPCLASVYRELKERKQLIGGESIEWDHWPNGTPPRPFVDLLIDELGNIAEDIFSSEETARNGSVKTKELWRWITMIANEGRKVGIRFIAALQDPTAKSVHLPFRRNCTLVSFQQGDASQSSAFLGATGAEHLQVGHFMALINGLVIGGGFSPSDDDIKSYLQQHAAPQTPAPAWIEGVVLNQPTLPKQPTIQLSAPAISVPEFVAGLSGWEARALELYEAGMDQAAIVESVFADDIPEIGNAAVADLIKRWRAVKTIDAPQATVKVDEIAELAEKIRSRWTPALNKTQTSELLGKTYEGTSWVKKVNQVIEYLKSTTPTDPQVPSNGGFHPSFQ